MGVGFTWPGLPGAHKAAQSCQPTPASAVPANQAATSFCVCKSCAAPAFHTCFLNCNHTAISGTNKNAQPDPPPEHCGTPPPKAAMLSVDLPQKWPERRGCHSLLLSHLLTNTTLSSLHDLLKLDLGIIFGIEIEVICLDPACDCNVGISVQNAEECFQLAFLLQPLPHPGPSGHVTCLKKFQSILLNFKNTMI